VEDQQQVFAANQGQEDITSFGVITSHQSFMPFIHGQKTHNLFHLIEVILTAGTVQEEKLLVEVISRFFATVLVRQAQSDSLKASSMLYR
jgi:hypothetical protein